MPFRSYPVLRHTTAPLRSRTVSLRNCSACPYIKFRSLSAQPILRPSRILYLGILDLGHWILRYGIMFSFFHVRFSVLHLLHNETPKPYTFVSEVRTTQHLKLTLKLHSICISWHWGFTQYTCAAVLAALAPWILDLGILDIGSLEAYYRTAAVQNCGPSQLQCMPSH